MSADRGLIGQTLGGRFRLTALLGEGAMAAVYRAEQDAEPHHVAVKVMHAELLNDPTFAKRFAREAKTASRIVHKNSVRILEHGADGRNLYLAMELLEGQDLFDVLARERRLPQLRAADMLVQVCDALSAAHAHGIVHRDLKPENVMVLADPSGGDIVKVLDFGIAKILERDQAEPTSSGSPIESAPPSSALTRVGGLVGTPEYMSPEQAMGMPVDARSDVYSCGALLFHVVTGRQPFIGQHPLEVLMQIPETPPPSPSSIVEGIHPEMERIILKAIAKAPDDRQQSAAELATSLRDFIARCARDGSVPSTSAIVRPVSSASLPGVPDRVVIEPQIAAPSEVGEAPPDTMRSSAPGHAAGAEATPADHHPLAATVASATEEEAIESPSLRDRLGTALQPHVEQTEPMERPTDSRSEPAESSMAPTRVMRRRLSPSMVIGAAICVAVMIWLARYLGLG